MRRAFLAMALLGLASAAVAQRPVDESEALVWSALWNLRQTSEVTLMISGTEQIGPRVRNTSATLYFRAEQPGSPAQLELDEYETSGQKVEMTRRIVGDGQTLWSYDIRRARYTIVSYGWKGTIRPKGAQNSTLTLLNNLNTQSSGPTAYLARVLRDTYAGDQPKFLSWAPGYAAGQSSENLSIPDPIVGTRSYQSTPSRKYVLYGVWNDRPTRSVAFQIDHDDVTASENLTSIFFAERTPNRVLDWAMLLMPGLQNLPTGSFNPYTPESLSGWVPLSGRG